MDYQELLLVTYNQPIVLLCRSTSSEVKYTLSTLSSVMNQDPASISVGLVFLRSNAWNGHDSQICASLLTVELFHDDRIQRIGQEKRGAMIVRTQLNNSYFASFLSQKKEVSRLGFFFLQENGIILPYSRTNIYLQCLACRGRTREYSKPGFLHGTQQCGHTRSPCPCRPVGGERKQQDGQAIIIFEVNLGPVKKKKTYRCSCSQFKCFVFVASLFVELFQH